ncbi:L-asparaginase II [Isoptericola dokdonensis DS-3]|uniref:L-asparaginase II n=1 Tax=Isoptericola dokdonensis DS-3 TaxID=1300344 RepID=A0A161I0F0_9MICO|nr:L-asparaginase II [Isoptericola dokdonensis DS-3]
MTAAVARGAAPLAEVVRGDLVESVHLGHLVVLDAAGDVVVSVGDPATTIWPRSSLKPVQAVAMLRAGLDLPSEHLALAAASHDGTARHVEVARAILAGAGLTPDDLANTPDLPLDPATAAGWQVAGHGPDRLTQNCSGKHAAMLATCVAAGWPTDGYLALDHPLQQAVRAAVAELCGPDGAVHATVDGCGAPLFSTTLVGLARGFSRLVTAPAGSPEARVAAAMSGHPALVGGEHRDATAAMRAVPGAVAKDGADGVYAAALPGGAAIAFKVLDGAGRPRPAVLVRALLLAGAAAVPGADVDALDALARTPVLGGGQPVGEVRAVVGQEQA